MTDRVTLVVELGALLREAERAGDAGAAHTLRAAIEAIMEASAVLSKVERRKASDRDRKRGERPPHRSAVSVDSTDSVEVVESAESQESAPSVESTDPPRSEVPPDPLLTHTPATHTHSREEPGEEAGEGGWKVALSLLQARLGEAGFDVVVEYLRAIDTRKSRRWYVELLRMIGPATGIEPEDLVAGLRDAMLVEPIVRQPGPLAAFVQFRKRERQRDQAGAGGGALQIVSGGRGGGKTAAIAEIEAGRAFGQILALIREHRTPANGTVRSIPRHEVEALGPRVFNSYDRTGGATRFLTQDGDKLGLVRRDFVKEYVGWTDPNPQREREA